MIDLYRKNVGMVGKFSKMAMGYFVTHVAGNRVDTEFLASLAAQCGASPAIQAAYLSMLRNTMVSTTDMKCGVSCVGTAKHTPREKILRRGSGNLSTHRENNRKEAIRPPG